MLDRVPKVVRGTHPIKHERAAAEKRALAKRLQGQRADDAADRLKHAEAGKAGGKSAGRKGGLKVKRKAK